MSRRINQQGSAVITALFIMALVAIATTAMTYRLQIDVKRLQWITISQQLQNSIEIPYYWARGNLLAIVDNSEDDENIPPMKLPQTMPPLVKNNIKITGKLQDAQRLYNLNNLLILSSAPNAAELQAKNLNYFANLIHSVLPEIDEQQAFDDAVKISESIITPATSALMISKRALPRNQFVSVSELRTFQGFTLKQYNKLAPFLVALPETTPVNVNQVGKKVLKAYFPGVETEKIDALLALRKEKTGFESFEDFKSKARSVKIPERVLVNGIFTLQSNYFFVEAHAQTQNMQRHSITLIKRNKSTNPNSQVEVVWQMVM